ncbi:MAG: hypothetical protein QOF61_3071 [Acidobacteriota bacterium]|jgi:hypothetical protein|nr:hypothetical protein [Acidobacteriota bacterium]
MAIRKMKTQRQQTDARLLLESDDPVELPPAEVEEGAIVLQFENLRQYVPELLETLRAGTVAELVPVMRDGSTFAVHTRTRTFWVKLWHAGTNTSRVERVQVLSCLPSTRGVRVLVGDDEEFDDAEFDEFDEQGEASADADDADDTDDAEPNINFESR